MTAAEIVSKPGAFDLRAARRKPGALDITSSPGGYEIPHDADAEAGALACILQANGDANKLLYKLEESFFHDLRHVAIFRTMVAIEGDGEAITPISLVTRLKANGREADAGGMAYVVGLPDKCTSPEQFPEFLRIIEDRAARRTMLAKSEADKQRALDLLTPIDVGSNTTTERLTVARFNILAPPPLETTVFQLSNGTPTHTRGNISALTAQAKAGKSALIAALIAAGITPHADCDLLGFQAVNPERLPVLLLDTEHSPAHHWKLCDRILRRAKLTESELLHAYRLAGFSVPDLNAALEHLLGERKWLAVILDGTGDFVADVNDPEECNAFVTRLHGMAIEHETHILNVLHLNPGSDFKSRGHLGSQLERKSETNLRIEKTDGVSVVFAERNRGADIPKKTGPSFVWSTDQGMHISAASIASVKQSADVAELRDQIAEAYRHGGKVAASWTEVVAWLQTVPGIKSKRTAERVFTQAKQNGVITQNLVKQWEQTA